MISKEILEKYIPLQGVAIIEKWIDGLHVQLTITPKRKSKLGDYQYQGNGFHKISVNGNLSKELFFFVLTHELAHLFTVVEYGRSVKSHGVEWKNIFGQLIKESIQVYPISFHEILLIFSRNPTASIQASASLTKLFKPIVEKNEWVYLEDLSFGTIFELQNKCFRKGTLKRTRYLCEEVQSNKKYLVNQLASVKIIKE